MSLLICGMHNLEQSDIIVKSCLRCCRKLNVCKRQRGNEENMKAIILTKPTKNSEIRLSDYDVPKVKPGWVNDSN